MDADIINSLGLGLDIVGIIMLFFFGLPPDPRKGGVGYLVWGEDKNEARKYDVFKSLSWLALFLVVCGFSLQIASNHL